MGSSPTTKIENVDLVLWENVTCPSPIHEDANERGPAGCTARRSRTSKLIVIALPVKQRIKLENGIPRVSILESRGKPIHSDL